MSQPNLFVYLASPYSHPDPAVRERRFREVAAVAGTIMAAGIHVFCPITHTHPIAEAADLPKGWDFWQEFDRRFVSIVDEVWVVTMDGFVESRGVRAEVDLAVEFGKPVRFVSQADPLQGVDPASLPQLSLETR